MMDFVQRATNKGAIAVVVLFIVKIVLATAFGIEIDIPIPGSTGGEHPFN